MRAPLSRKLAGFGTTIFTEMTRLANEHGAINLAQGFPDFDGPQFVKDAAAAAVLAGHNQYARMSGLPDLHSVLAAKYRRHWGLDYRADEEFTVTSGATEALFDAINGLCDVGDEVVCFEPFYDSYRASICLAGAVARVVTLEAPDWRFDREQVRRAFTPRTRLLLLNTPHNPTGKVYTREELAFLAGLCVEHDVICVADEVYEHLVYDGAHIPIATLPGMRERTITISSLGKTFSLTGWKIGWAAAPAPLTAAVRAAHQFVTFATATPLQHAAAVALASGPDYYADLVGSYRRKRDFLAGELRRLGFEVKPPDGTYFLLAGYRAHSDEDDVAFCRRLIQLGVAAIPPSVFYDNPQNARRYVRFAFCKRDETLQSAVARLERLAG